MGVIMMAMTICGLFIAGILLIISFFKQWTGLRTFVLGGVSVWLLGYAILLAVGSISSQEQTLGLNEPKEFCGFYLDCHLHTAVVEVRKTKTIGGRTASGEFYIVKLKVSSDAKNPEILLGLAKPNAAVKDADGKMYTRLVEAENELPTAKTPFDQKLSASKPFEKEIVFDLPMDIKDPRLNISEGFGIDKVIEAFLIGDEDSIFHKRTFFTLDNSERIAGTIQ